MKTRWLLVMILGVAPLCLSSAEPGASGYVITERGPNHRVWKRETVIETANGFRTNVCSYVELASGLHVPQGDGSFVPANPSFAIMPNGAEAQNTRHKVSLAADINVEEAVQITMLDGATLRGTPIGFGYYDPVSGEQVILAAVKSAIGWLISSNEVVYSNCFNGVRASIHCQNRLGGFSQSLLLHEQVPPPEVFGFSSRTRLQLFTQLADNQPPPVQTPRFISRELDPAVRAMMVSPDFTDTTLMFGSARMGAGRAFGTDDGFALKPIGSTRAPVGKSYGVIDGKNILIEAAEYERIRSALTNLPPSSWSGITNASISTDFTLPIARLAAVSNERIQRVAKAESPRAGSQYAFVVDYEVVSGSETDYHFLADTTYFISSTLYLYGNTVFEGGAVVKIGDSGGMIFFGSTLETRTSAYRPLVITAAADDSIGEVIDGSTGVPTNYSWALYLESELHRPLHDFRISYADEALTPIYYGGNLYEFSHAQFVHCGIAVYVNADCSFRNVLMSDVTTGFESAYTVSVEHGTFNRLATLNVLNDLRLTNCLLVAVTNTGSYSGSNNAVESDPSGVFSAVGAGAHYLVNGSTNRNAGTTNINASLARDLQQRTTYPPTVIANATISTNLTLAIAAPRETNTSFDIGFAYVPLDYVFGSNVLTNATLTIPAGVALGTFTPGSNTHGLLLLSGSSVDASGSPTNLARIVRYNTVQELASVWNTAYPGASIREPAGPHATAPSATFRFTDWSVSSGEPAHLDARTGNTNTFSFRDSTFAGGKLESDRPQFWFTNCLFQRVVGYFSEAPGQNTNRWYNNTFFGGTWTFYNSGSGPWEIFNNAFYGTADLTSDAGFPHGWNAYLPGAPMVAGWLSNGIVTNIVFQSGPLGDFYLTNTSLLLNRGTNNALDYGLYHFTITTNQTKESTSRTDIGFHYVALDANGIPLDYDSDGMPDYYEDANGNGSADTNAPLFETNWTVNDGSDDPDGDWITNLQEYENGTNPYDKMLVAWGINNHGQCNVPAGLRNVASMGGGIFHTAVLLSDGSVACWGNNGNGQTNVPANLRNVVALAVGPYHQVALRNDGTAVAWGNWVGGSGAFAASVAGWSNIVGIAAGNEHDIACKNDGTVVIASATNDVFTTVPSGLSNVIAVAAGSLHNVALKNDGTVVAWGYDTLQFFNLGLTNVPSGLSNVTAISAGACHTLALKSDGTVVAWGAGSSTNVHSALEYEQSIVPAGLGNVIAISAGGFSSMALRSDGTIAVWGELSAPLFSLTNIQRIACPNQAFGLAVRGGRLTPFIRNQPASQTTLAGQTVTFTIEASGLAGVTYQWQFYGVNLPGETNATLTLNNVGSGLQGDYRVIASTGAGSVTSTVATLTLTNSLPGDLWIWGSNSDGQRQQPWNLRDVIAAAGGARHTLAVKDGGTVVGWGANDYGQTNVPSSATNVIAVACGNDHNLVLKEDGKIVAWGRNQDSQTNVPTGVTNAVAISAGGHQSLALLKNGSVQQWGETFASVPANVLSNVVSIASGKNFHLALLTNTTVVAWGANTSGQTNVPAGLTNVVAIAAGGTHALALRENGTVVAWGANASGQTNVPANLSNVISVAAGSDHSIARRNDGTAVAWGDNTYGQTNIPVALTNAQFVAAGAYHSMAAIDSRFLEYPVNVSRDLLLICNTNVESRFVKDYYLAHRPMAAQANVLEIGYAPQETIWRTDFTNVFRMPILNWLTNNPTKRPRYWILFLGVPSRITEWATNEGWYPPSLLDRDHSVSYELSLLPTSRNPLVTHINMGNTNHIGDTNACRAYIDKLENFGTIYSPGRVIISASAGGYGNTNYYFDDTRTSYCCGPGPGATARDGVIQSGVPAISVIYSNAASDYLTNHILTATNVAGYLCWGAHSSLGAYYAVDGTLTWHGNKSWWIIETVESFNGQRFNEYHGQGNFIQWLSGSAFGGTNFAATPVGAVSHTDEPFLPGINEPGTYFGYWASGKLFSTAAWASRQTPYFQAVGDPFVKR